MRREDRAFDRRTMMRRMAPLAGAAWAAPSVFSLSPVAAATGSPPIQTTGAVVQATLSPGDDLDTGGDWTSNTAIYLFAENCRILTASETTSSGDTLPTGQLICSYLLHFAPDPPASRRLAGTVTFSGPILGYDTTNARLAAGDPDWGVASVLYPSGNRFRFLENSDRRVFDFAACFVSIDFRARAPGVDQLRVFVAA